MFVRACAISIFQTIVLHLSGGTRKDERLGYVIEILNHIILTLKITLVRLRALLSMPVRITALVEYSSSVGEQIQPERSASDVWICTGV